MTRAQVAIIERNVALRPAADGADTLADRVASADLSAGDGGKDERFDHRLLLAITEPGAARDAPADVCMLWAVNDRRGWIAR